MPLSSTDTSIRTLDGLQLSGTLVTVEASAQHAVEVRKFYKAFKKISYKEVMLGKRLNHAGHCFVFEKS